MRKILPLLAAVVAVLVIPFVVSSPYYLHLLQTIAIFAIVVLGLDIVFGYTGEVSIGHAALFGIGSYTAGVLSMHFNVGFWPSLVAAPIVTAAFGALLALPAIEVTGPYLAMVTLAFGTIVQILINEIVPLTNGPLGIKFSTPALFDWRDYSNVLPFLDMSAKRMKESQFFILSGIALGAGLLPALVMIGLRQPIMGSYGPEYLAGQGALVFLLLAAPLHAMANIGATALQSMERAWVAMGTTFLWAIAFLVATYFLAFRLGAIGVAAALAISYAVMALCRMACVVFELRVSRG